MNISCHSISPNNVLAMISKHILSPVNANYTEQYMSYSYVYFVEQKDPCTTEYFLTILKLHLLNDKV